MKHREISNQLAMEIAARKYVATGRLPSEAQLVKRFGVSRPTVGRALRELQDQGLVERRVGSGTYVKESVSLTGTDQTGNSFRQLGLILTSYGKPEIFESITGELSNISRVNDFALWWGGSVRTKSDVDTRVEEVEALVDQFIEKSVAGAFFVPFEHRTHNVDINTRITSKLIRAGIPVVLIDRDIGAFPSRSDLDLVGIDNFYGGYYLAEHLIKLGCKQLIFVSLPNSAAPADARMAGVRAALFANRIPLPPQFSYRGDPADVKFVRNIMAGSNYDAIVCTNDLVAAVLMQTLTKINVQVPRDIRVVGFDDIRVASLLSVPLTTMHQPCRDIANIAFATMMQRIADPSMPAKQILLRPHLVVRGSCGAYAVSQFNR